MITRSSCISIFDNLRYRLVVIILFSLLALLLVANKAYYTQYPNQLSLKPIELSLLNEQTHRIKFLDKHTEQGKIILKRMYGVYDSMILNNDYPVSTPVSAEFTLPQFWYNGSPYILREHPALRYELWKHKSPDVILLGSSIFFCDFSRQVFYEKYPDKYLLDFTTGNNTPFIASWFMHYADSIGLEFKPGMVVLYGMNRVEMLKSYKTQHSHEYVKEAIKSKGEQPTFDQLIEQYLCMPQLRYDLTNTLKDKYDDWFRGGNMYRKAIDKKYLDNETAFIRYMQSAAAVTGKDNTFDEERIEEILSLADFLQQRGCKLVLLKLPQSLYNDIVLSTGGHSWFDKEITRLQHENIRYIDVSDLKEYNLSQLNYTWPGNIFDPEHLNIDGAEMFTASLIQQVLDTMLAKQNTIH